MDDRPTLLAFRPPHPGEYLREDILPALNMTINDFAQHLGVSRNTISRLINEKSSVSTDMAIRLGQAFKNGARYWLALQMQHDLWVKGQEDSVHVEPFEWGCEAA